MDDEVKQLLLRREELHAKVAAAKENLKFYEKKREEEAKELERVREKRTGLALAMGSLERSEKDRLKKLELQQNNLDAKQKVIGKLGSLLQVMAEQKRSNEQNLAEAEKLSKAFAVQVQNAPWIPAKQELIDQLTDRRECLKLSQMKLQELKSRGDELKEILDGHERYPFRQLCISLAIYSLKRRQMQNSYNKERRTNIELKAKLARCEEELSTFNSQYGYETNPNNTNTNRTTSAAGSQVRSSSTPPPNQSTAASQQQIASNIRRQAQETPPIAPKPQYPSHQQQIPMTTTLRRSLSNQEKTLSSAQQSYNNNNDDVGFFESGGSFPKGILKAQGQKSERRSASSNISPPRKMAKEQMAKNNCADDEDVEMEAEEDSAVGNPNMMDVDMEENAGNNVENEQEEQNTAPTGFVTPMAPPPLPPLKKKSAARNEQIQQQQQIQSKEKSHEKSSKSNSLTPQNMFSLAPTPPKQIAPNQLAQSTTSNIRRKLPASHLEQQQQKKAPTSGRNEFRSIGGGDGNAGENNDDAGNFFDMFGFQQQQQGGNECRASGGGGGGEDNFFNISSYSQAPDEASVNQIISLITGDGGPPGFSGGRGGASTNETQESEFQFNFGSAEKSQDSSAGGGFNFALFD